MFRRTNAVGLGTTTPLAPFTATGTYTALLLPPAGTAQSAYKAGAAARRDVRGRWRAGRRGHRQPRRSCADHVRRHRRRQPRPRNIRRLARSRGVGEHERRRLQAGWVAARVDRLQSRRHELRGESREPAGHGLLYGDRATGQWSHRFPATLAVARRRRHARHWNTSRCLAAAPGPERAADVRGYGRLARSVAGARRCDEPSGPGIARCRQPAGQVAHRLYAPHRRWPDARYPAAAGYRNLHGV
jgi:hypothetical protein